MSKIKVLKCEPGKCAEFIEINNELEEFQKVVGGYIEVVNIGNGILIICNENGKSEKLPPNRPLYYSDGRYLYDILLGTFLICTTDGEEFYHLNGSDYEKVGDRYYYPYTFNKINIEEMEYYLNFF